MLTIEIRINGSIICAITGINSAGIEECTYSYHAVTFPIDFKDSPRLASGTVKHRRSHGIEKLASIICKAAGAAMETQLTGETSHD